MQWVLLWAPVMYIAFSLSPCPRALHVCVGVPDVCAVHTYGPYPHTSKYGLHTMDGASYHELPQAYACVLRGTQRRILRVRQVLLYTILLCFAKYMRLPVLGCGREVSLCVLDVIDRTVPPHRRSCSGRRAHVEHATISTPYWKLQPSDGECPLYED